MRVLFEQRRCDLNAKDVSEWYDVDVRSVPKPIVDLLVIEHVDMVRIAWGDKSASEYRLSRKAPEQT